MNREVEINLRNYGLIFLYLIFTTGIIYLLFSHWAYDDPYITYRYAYNLVQGKGFVYNAGERILSTTTPLFAVLLALLANIWNDLPHLANLVGAFSIALGGIFLWDLAHSWKTPVVGWAGLLLYPTFPLLLSTIGSETPLYLAFCLGAFAFYARRRYTFAATFSALAVLTRPDGVLVPVLLGIDYLLRERHTIPWRGVFLFLLLTIPWYIFAWVYFGSPLPATLATKQHQGAMIISQRFAPGLVTITKGYVSHWQYWLEAVLALSGIFGMFWQERRWILLLSWTVLYFLAYTILGVTRYFWYYAPLVPGFIVLVGLGLSLIYEHLPKVLHQVKLNHKTGAMVSHVFAVLLLVFLAFTQVQSLWRLRQMPDSRIAIYRAVGEWLAANTPPHASVGALEVGILGYYAQRSMVDFAGLIQPDIAEQLKSNTTYEDAALWAVSRYHPHYLILLEEIFPRLEEDYVSRQCHFLRTFEGASYEYSRNINIYACIQ